MTTLNNNYNKNKDNHNHKHSASTDNLYQSTFMPIFSDAEARIKKLVVLAFFLGLGLMWLRREISNEIIKVKKEIPTNLKDRDIYVNGLIASANILIKHYQRETHIFVNHLKRQDIPTKTSPKRYVDMLTETKGSPQIEWYNKEIEKYIEKVNNTPITTNERNKHHISLWQKAELDVRHDKQMAMVDSFLQAGKEYAYISSHPDCSERCQLFQGKLVSLTKHSIKNPPKKIKSYKDLKLMDFFVERLDGINVYSLIDIMAVEDKYGYNNMIISGFNCRHHLLNYQKGKVPPKEYNEEEIKKQREIEQKIREMERHIRSLKMKLNEYNSISSDVDKNIAKKRKVLKARIKSLVAEYKKFCNENGYAWYDYRINVRDNEIYK